MEVRSRPPRIFGPNKILIPFDFTPAFGKDIIRKYKLKQIDYEKILFFDEIQTSKKKRDIAQLILTNVRIIYLMVGGLSLGVPFGLCFSVSFGVSFSLCFGLCFGLCFSVSFGLCFTAR